METPPPLPEPPPPPSQLPPREGMGCFAAGCLVVVVVVAFFIAVGGVGAWLLYGRAVTMFTSRQPADVRIANVSDVDLHNAERKLNQLGQAAANNEETTVEFTAAELNAMIAREPLFAELNNRVRIAMADSLMNVEMSAPLDAAPLPKLRGRWLNGGARFGFSFSLGEFAFEPKWAEANGHLFPEEFFTAFTPSFNRRFNDGFRREVEKNDQAALFWKHIKTIAVDRDRLVVATQRL